MNGTDLSKIEILVILIINVLRLSDAAKSCLSPCHSCQTFYEESTCLLLIGLCNYSGPLGEGFAEGGGGDEQTAEGFQDRAVLFART